MRSGASPPSMTAFMAADTATPGSFPRRSPVEYTFVAPCAPSGPASEAPSPATNADTVPPSCAAFETSSSVCDVGAPLAACANTQMLLAAMSDHLQVLEEGDDLGVALTVVFDDLAGL